MPPVTLTVAVPSVPTHAVGSVPDIVTVGALGAFRDTELVPVQLEASVTVTVNVPPVSPVILEVVAPLLQL